MDSTASAGVSDRIATYIRAKDSNRPHGMPLAFAPEARLEMVVKAGTIAFPPLTVGVEAIADVLVRRFAQAFENVYTFCLCDPPRSFTPTFSCDWLVGMSEKQGGAVRVGCGRYDWSFRSGDFLADRLTITIERMETLPPSSLRAVMDGFERLPYPWCPVETAMASFSRIDGLHEVHDHLGRHITAAG